MMRRVCAGGADLETRQLRHKLPRQMVERVLTRIEVLQRVEGGEGLD